MISRMKATILGNLSWYKTLALVLGLISVFITIFIISQLDRGIHLTNLRQIVFLATFFALSLFLIKDFKPFLLILLSFSVGVIVVYTNVGNLLQPLFAYLRLEINHIFSIIQAQFSTEDIFPDPTLAQAQWDVLEQSVQVLYSRQRDWLVSLPESVYDPVSLNLTWGIVVWLLTNWVFWHIIKKKRVVVGFLPLLIIIAGASPSVESSLVWLFLILGFGLLLEVLSKQASMEEFWEKRMFNASERIRGGTIKYALSLSVFLVFFAGVITSPRLDEFIKDLRERRQQSGQSQGQGSGDSSDNTFLEEEAATGPEDVLNDTADGWLPNVHLIGSGPELAEIEVFNASVQESNSGLAARYYFRSATYETFNQKGWQNIGKDIVLVPPEQEFEIDFTPNEKLIYQEVNLQRDFPKGNLIYVVGELSGTNVFYYGSYHTKFLNNTYTDLFASVTDATQYSAYSIVPFYGETDLRNASQDYPTWIANKYLQVPDTITDRVQELALSLTATQPTPYDRALAIESYLRGFEYTLDIEAPPRSQDIVDYFLFDIQKGYCDYFASSMVILTRAAGIPARLATGYLASNYDPETGRFVVTADQAHSWAEVYFPEYGWVTFEPTAGQPAPFRQDERQLLPENFAFEPQIEGQIKEPDTSRYLIPENLFILTGELFTIALIGIVAFHWIDYWLLARMESDKSLAKIYKRLQKLSSWLGVKTTTNDTPLEYSTALSRTLEILRTNKSMHGLLQAAPQKAVYIIEVCNLAAYSDQTIEAEKIRQVIHFWGYLRWHFIVTWLLLRIQPIQASLKRIWFRLQQPA